MKKLIKVVHANSVYDITGNLKEEVTLINTNVQQTINNLQQINQNIPTKVSLLINDAEYVTAFESDVASIKQNEVVGIFNLIFE